MRIASRTLLAVIAALTMSVAPAHAAAFSVNGGISDNYKASFNADPQARELRTWLSMDSITAGGTTWTPSVPAAVTFSAPLTLTNEAGDTAQLAITSTSANVESSILRVDPPKSPAPLRWGPLVTLAAPMDSAHPKVRIGLSLTSGGTTIATGVLDYWAATFAGTGSSIENNGPAGQWRVEGFPLDTDWQTGSTPSRALVATVPLAPRATGLIASRRGGTVRVRATARAAQGARVLLARYRLGSGAFTPWKRASVVYVFSLRAGARARVTAEVRDIRGFASKPIMRTVG